ncbi:MAG: hypothetical protein WCH99_09700 [Verrucomicrobiota bacterium]
MKKFTSGWIILFHLLPKALMAFDYGDLDSNYFPPNGWQGYEWQDSSGWTEVDAVKEGILPDTSSINVSKQLEALVDKYQNKKIRIRFPAGTWRFTESCKLHKPGGGLMLKGSGREKTHFVIDTKESVSSEIMIDGATRPPGNKMQVLETVRRGDQNITVSTGDAAKVPVGSYLRVNGVIPIPKDSDNPDGIFRKWAQIVRVTHKAGAKVFLDMKLGMDMPNAQVNVLELGEECGVEGIHIARLRIAPINTRNLSIHNVSKGFVRDCEVTGSITGGIFISSCRDFIVTRNLVHELFVPMVKGAYNYHAGSHGDGILVGGFSTAIHVTNNRVWNLRHHIILIEANHCVVSYNKLEPAFHAYGDLAQHNGHCGHNNLFEGNIGSDMATDNYRNSYMPTAYITYFRNHAAVEIGSLRPHSSNYAIVGNEIEGKQGVVNVGISNAPFYVGANLIENKLQTGQVSKTANIPPSLVYSVKPEYVAKWPLYGP